MKTTNTTLLDALSCNKPGNENRNKPRITKI